MKSRDLDLADAEKRLMEFTNPEEIHNFVEGETRPSIIKAAGKRLLRIRGGVTCEDVLEALRKKGVKI